jgi:V/A-type H+-transporting ATPase subunit K
MKMNYKISFITLTIIATLFLQFVPLAYAQEEGDSFAEGMKYLGAGIAFAGASLAAGIAIGKAGSASLAAAAENENLKTYGMIITALAEAVAIYGIVVALLILGS